MKTKQNRNEVVDGIHISDGTAIILCESGREYEINEDDIEEEEREYLWREIEAIQVGDEVLMEVETEHEDELDIIGYDIVKSISIL
jgi:hypothetical protein